jgi:VanZ family protein
MNEQNGQIIHNAVRNHFHLTIPARFKILKKNFLKLSGNALKLNGSSLRDIRINILGFIPIGFLLLVTIYSTKSSWTSSWRLIFLVVLGGTVLSLVIEILQAYLPARNSSLTDLIFNTFGTALGVIFALLLIRLKTRSQRTSFSESQ